MAIDSAYASAAEYRASIDKVDTSEDAEVLVDLTTVSRYIEHRTTRFFNKDAAAVARIYQPKWPDALEVDDVVSITTVKVDADLDGTYETTLTAGTDYELLPRNAADGPEPGPYTTLKRLTGAWLPSSRVEVTAVFGWPSVPGPVKAACIHLTAILRLETPRAQAQVTDLGQIVSINPQARGLIENLILDYGAVTL